MNNSSVLHLGLLMTYNEADVIEEVLASNSLHVDAIFALDGSSDGTFEILKAHPKMRLVLRDEDVARGRKVLDSDRQVLLESARAEFGPGHWYTLLHGDEIFHHNPLEVIQAAQAEGAHFVNWAAMQFFLHTSDQGKDLEAIASVQERVRWYSPFWFEVRQFRDRPQAHYPPQTHGSVVPKGIGWRPWSRVPLFKHYPYRSPEQMAAKRLQSGFSGAHKQELVLRESYQPGYLRAMHFEEDFGRLEGPRPLWQMWLWQRQYVNFRGL